MASGTELAMILRAKDEASATFDKVKGSAGGLASGVGSMIEGIGRAGVAVGGIMAIGTAITSVATSMVSGNVEMETYQTQLGTLLGGADAAKERIQQLAKIGAETPFDLPQLMAAEKIMAGFGLTTEKTQQLTGRSLDDYRRSIGDMAAATGAPLDEVTLLWSKFGSGATGEAISRLQELGIVTREQMAGMGVEFSKSGELVTPIPQAMKIAMDLANEKMGGGMKALSSTFAGQMSTLGDNFNQAKVLLMAPIFDVLKTGLSSLNEMLSSETFTSTITSMAETGAAAIATLIEVFGQLATVFQGGIVGEGVGDMLDQWFPPGVTDGIIDMVFNLGETFRAVFAGDIPGILDGVTGIVDGFGEVIVGAVESWATAFASWVDGADTGMMDGVASIETNLLGWLITVGASIVEKLAEWAGAFVDWIAPKIPGMLEALGRYLSELAGWMLGTALPFILEKMVEWGVAFVEWVAPRIAPLLLALGGLLLELGGWLLGTALPAIVSKLLEWGLAFARWVPGAIVGLLFELGKLEVELILWVGKQVSDIVLKLAEWGGAFLGWVAKDVIPTLPDKLGAILTAISAWVSQKVTAVADSVKAIGGGILTGIQDGISGALAGFWNWLQTTFVEKIPATIRKILNLQADSGAMAMVGARMVEELKIGISNAWPSLEELWQRLGVGMAGGSGPALIQQIGAIAAGIGGVDFARAAMAISASETGGGRLMSEVGGTGAQGPFQFDPGGELRNFAKYLHTTVAEAGMISKSQPMVAAKWALEGYLGDAIRAGLRQGLTGAALAVFASRVGQRPAAGNELKAGEWYRNLFPGLAQGGIVTRPTLAMIGEAGPEAIIPLSRAVGVGGGGGSSVQTVNVRVFLGTREFQDVFVETYEDAQEQGRLN